MKYAVITFGCRVNHADSLALEAELRTRGGEVAPPDRAELVIVNTCSVTASADQGTRQTIRRIARANPGARIVATGCHATRCHDEVAALPGVIAVVPNDRKAPASLMPVLLERQVWTSSGADGPCGRLPAPGEIGRTSWTLRVQTGCDEPCSYCIIPATRGTSRSRPMADVLTELGRVVAAGYKEVVLTGVHLGSYGRDCSPRASLAELLAALSTFGAAAAELRSCRSGSSASAVVRAGEAQGFPQPLQFRISSLEPMDCTTEVLDVICRGPGSEPALARFAPHLHLPLQHASNRVLAAMRRPYTIEQYAALVDEIRQRLPRAAIGTDVIVGFPGERDADFEALVQYLAGSPLTYVHVFPYSDRPGTVASALDGKVHGTVVKARAARVRDLSRVLHDRFRRGQHGCTRPALTVEDGCSAVTDNYIRVSIAPGRERNEWVEVTL